MSSKPNNAPEPRAPGKKKGMSRRAAGVLLAMLLIALALIFLIPRAPAPPPSPARPDTVFVDKVGLVSPEFALETSRWLYAMNLFEGVVYIDGKTPEGDLQPWTVQTASEWGVGTERQDRGLVLFIFRDPRVVRAEIGYGLEGVLPDVTVKRLLETLVAPAFSQGQYEKGLEAFIKMVYEMLGGDAASARQALEEAGKPNDAWGETLEAAWKNGARLLPAVWRFYSQGTYLDRFGVLAFATPILFFSVVSLVAFLISLRMLVLLPGKLRALWTAPAAAVSPDENTRKRAPNNAPKGAPRNAPAASLAGLGDGDPRWGTFMLVTPIVLGVFLFLITGAIATLIFSMAPDYFTRQGQYGGGGVAVTWSAVP
jgi:uncharacterized protein